MAKTFACFGEGELAVGACAPAADLLDLLKGPIIFALVMLGYVDQRSGELILAAFR
jgi:hypothetical protein